MQGAPAAAPGGQSAGERHHAGSTVGRTWRAKLPGDGGTFVRVGDWLALLVLAAVWGGSFVFVRVAAPVLGPPLLVAARLTLAGLALLAYAALTRQTPPLGARWPWYLTVELAILAVPFLLLATAQLTLTAPLTTTLNATAPLFSALAAAHWLDEPFGRRRAAGLLLGILCVALLVGLGPLPLAPDTLGASLLVLLAAAAYDGAAVFVRRAHDPPTPPALSIWSQLLAAPRVLPGASFWPRPACCSPCPFAWPSAPPAPAAIASVLALALLSTTFAYLLYFRLIASVGPTNALLVAYLSPAFGRLWGALVLAEPLGLTSFAGFALILASVALVTSRPRATRPATDPAPPSARAVQRATH